MAPFSSSQLLVCESIYNDDVFQFQPLKMELDAAFLEPIMFTEPEVPPLRATVRFAVDDLIINIEPEFYGDDDIATKWYSNEDLTRIKLHAKDLCNELRRSDSPQDKTLTIAHHKTSLMLNSDFKALVKLSPSTPDQDLTEWCSYMDGRRGLERFASRDYTILRRSDITKTRQAVLAAAKLRCDAETIAHAAREASRRARTFARFLAAADADVAKVTEELRRVPARAVSMRPESSAFGINSTVAPTTTGRPNTLFRRVPSRTPSTFTKTRLPSATTTTTRVVPLRSKSMRPAETSAPSQRCAPARKRSKQVHGSSDLRAMAR